MENLMKNILRLIPVALLVSGLAFANTSSTTAPEGENHPAQGTEVKKEVKKEVKHDKKGKKETTTTKTTEEKKQ